jgi:hypothetical protein
MWPCLIHTCRAVPIPLWKRLFMATAQNGMGTAWYIWINMGRLSTARGQTAQVRLFGLLRGHSRTLLTRMLVCLIVLLTVETADYTEYELTLKLKPVFLLLLCYVSIMYCTYDCLWTTTLKFSNFEITILKYLIQTSKLDAKLSFLLFYQNTLSIWYFAFC